MEYNKMLKDRNILEKAEAFNKWLIDPNKRLDGIIFKECGVTGLSSLDTGEVIDFYLASL